MFATALHVRKIANMNRWLQLKAFKNETKLGEKGVNNS